jgi:hypothetical protein
MCETPISLFGERLGIRKELIGMSKKASLGQRGIEGDFKISLGYEFEVS